LIDHIIANDDKLLVFITISSKSSSKLYRQEYDNKCKPLGKAVEIFSYQIEKKQGVYYRYTHSKNQMFFSVDANHYDDNNGNNKHSHLIFKNDFSKVSECQYLIEDKNENHSRIDNYLSDNGIFYSLIKVFNLDQKGKVLDINGYEKFILIQVNTGKVEQKDLKIKTNLYISDLVFDIVEETYLNVTGIYDWERKDQALFYFQYNLKEGNIVNQGLLPFTNDLIPDDEETTGAANKDNQVSLENYEIRDIKSLNDGSFIGVIEYYSSFTLSDGTQNYQFGDILIYKINSAGKMEWLTPIRCHQHHNIKINHGSFEGYWNGNQYFIIFGDRLAHYENDGKYHHDYSKVLSNNEYCVSQVVLDLKTGQYKRSILLKKDKLANLVAMPTHFKSNYSNSSLIFYFNQKKNELFGIMKFN
jgi:hypothetical protein